MPDENATSQTEASFLETAEYIIGLDGTSWVLIPINRLRQTYLNIVEKTANYTATEAESGSLYENTGATGTVVISLPAATVGLEYRAHVCAAFALRLDPNGSQIIGNPTAGSADGGGGRYISSSTVGAAIHLVCMATGRWEVQAVKGTWALEA